MERVGVVMNRQFLTIGMFLVLLGVLHSACTAGDDLSKATIVDNTIKALLVKNQQLNKYTVTVTRTSVMEIDKPIRTIVTSIVTYNGLKQVAEKFVQAEINGLSVSEEELKELRVGKNRSPVRGLNFTAVRLEDNLSLINSDRMGKQCSLESSEAINGLQVYKIKYIPVNPIRFKEADLYIDKTGYQIIKVIVIGIASDQIHDSVMTVNYVKSIKEFFMPDLIQIEVNGVINDRTEDDEDDTDTGNQRKSFKYRGEIKYSDYQIIN